MPKTQAKQLVVCVDNDGYAASLEKRKIYVALRDTAAEKHAMVRIVDDRGGPIGAYVDRYRDLRSSGQAVIIDGLCASACTIVLGKILQAAAQQSDAKRREQQDNRRNPQWPP